MADYRIEAYLGRDNRTYIDLTQGGDPVTANAITRAVFHLDGECIDTDIGADPIELINDAQTVAIRFGLWPAATAGNRRGHLVVFDAAAPNGLVWPDTEPQQDANPQAPTFRVRFVARPICD